MRPIDADALIEAIKDYPYGFRGMIVCDIAKQPTINPVKYGKWERHNGWDVCTVCGAGMQILTVYGMKRNNYCPNCGAKMERS